MDTYERGGYIKVPTRTPPPCRFPIHGGARADADGYFDVYVRIIYYYIKTGLNTVCRRLGGSMVTGF